MENILTDVRVERVNGEVPTEERGRCVTRLNNGCEGDYSVRETSAA